MKKLIFAIAMVFTSATFASSYSCKAELVSSRGRILDSFRSTSYWSRQDACHSARMQCNREKDWRRRQGRNHAASCQIVRGRHGGGHGGGQVIVKRCSVDRVGRRGRGRVVQTHNASANGRRGDGVKRRACQRAMRNCQRSAIRAQVCIRR